MMRTRSGVSLDNSLIPNLFTVTYHKLLQVPFTRRSLGFWGPRQIMAMTASKRNCEIEKQQLFDFLVFGEII
jgi:hypothetical protein